MPKIRHRLFTTSSSSSNLASAFDAVSSPSAASSPYCQLLQLTSSPSSHSYKSPSPLMAVDLEEDVLVMDGVLVSDSKSNLNSRRISFSSSSGEYGSSVSSNSVGVCKTELCRSWEELGVCRYGAKCQFAHGKEELRFELRGPRFWKQKSEVVGGSGNNSVPSAGSYCYSNRYHHPNSPPKPTTDSGITARYNDRCHPHSLLSHATPDSATPKKLTPSKTIDVTLTKTPESSKSSTFSWPPTKEEDAFITMVLYGPSTKRRLPVFEDICPQ